MKLTAMTKMITINNIFFCKNKKFDTNNSNFIYCLYIAFKYLEINNLEHKRNHSREVSFFWFFFGSFIIFWKTVQGS